MQETKSVFYFLYVVGFLDKYGPGFNLSGTRGVLGNPISTYQINPQFYAGAMLRDYYINNGIQNGYQRNIQSRFHQQKTTNLNRASKVPNNYQIFVFEEGNVNKERDQYNFLNIILNYALGNKFSPKSEVNNEYFYLDIPENFVKEQKLSDSLLPIPNITNKNPIKFPETQYFQKNPEQNSQDSTTTEQAAILGLPITIPMSNVNLDRKNSSEIASQKQCVQDCPSSSAYNPVCGTNNVTFFNEEKFLCAQNCGISVLISKRGACT